MLLWLCSPAAVLEELPHFSHNLVEKYLEKHSITFSITNSSKFPGSILSMHSHCVQV